MIITTLNANSSNSFFSFEDHASAIRGEDKNLIAAEYNKVVKSGVLQKKPSEEAEFASSEQVLYSPAHTIHE